MGRHVHGCADHQGENCGNCNGAGFIACYMVGCGSNP